MDASDPHVSPSTSHSSNDENENLIKIQSKRAEFLKTYEAQDFSLPDSFMFYITKNPSCAHLYEKIIQTCKDFFVKNPILVVFDLVYKCDKWFVDRKPLNLDKFTSKFWIKYEFLMRPDNSIINKAVNENLTSSIVPRIFRCDVERLILDDQILSFTDLCLLVMMAEYICLYNVTIKENDGTIVGIEKIVKVADKAKDIYIFRPPVTSITSKTMKELIEIPNFSKLDGFSLNHVPNAFDIEALFFHIKKNQHTSFCFVFDDSISDAYKNHLEEIIDEIIETEIITYKLPFIRFPGMSREKQLKLLRISLNN